MTYEQIHARLKERFGAAVLEGQAAGAQPYVVIEAQRMTEVALFLRDQADLAFDRLLCLSGVDYEGMDLGGKGKHVEISQYEENGTVRPVELQAQGDLGVVYHLESSSLKHRCVLKVRVPRAQPKVAWVGAAWVTAQWGERETYDLFGIEFTGHPDLRRILLPEDWEGWPLRKDYQMPSAYQGIPLEGSSYSEGRGR
jgi:NADH-quinone oxidoreductase subunit C